MKLGRASARRRRREDGVEARSRAATRGITKALRGPVAHRLERVDQLPLIARRCLTTHDARRVRRLAPRRARASREARAQNVRALYHWARQLEGKCFEALSRYAQNRKAKRLDVERAFYARARDGVKSGGGCRGDDAVEAGAALDGRRRRQRRALDGDVPAAARRAAAIDAVATKYAVARENTAAAEAARGAAAAAARRRAARRGVDAARGARGPGR